MLVFALPLLPCFVSGVDAFNGGKGKGNGPKFNASRLFCGKAKALSGLWMKKVLF